MLAHLIKSFLRALPGGLFGGVPLEVIGECDCDAGCVQLLGALPPPARPVVAWLVRVCVAVASRRAVNRMNLRNLTLVFAPNLLGNSGDGKGKAKGKKAKAKPEFNPVEELMSVEYCANALYTLIGSATRGLGLNL